MMRTTFVSFLLLLPIIIADDPCRFTHPDKGTIDISSLGNKDGTPAYKDKIPTTGSNYKYSYNPCNSFTEGSVCRDVAACQVSLDGVFTFPVGIQDTARWEVPTGLGSNPIIIYTAPEGKITRVTLECRKSGPDEFEAQGEEPINTYKFRLAHRCSCWDECGGGPGPGTTSTGSPSPGGGGGGSVGGTVFVILLLVLLVVYFVGFAIFYRVREQRSGADLIAHRTFWTSLPGYARDGVVYCYRRIVNKGGDPYASV